MEDAKKNIFETLEKVPTTHPKTHTNTSTSSSTQPVSATVKVCKLPADVLSVISGMTQKKLLLEDFNTTDLNSQL